MITGKMRRYKHHDSESLPGSILELKSDDGAEAAIAQIKKGILREAAQKKS